MTSYKLTHAAILAKASYSAEGIVTPRIIKSLDHDDVQAYLLNGKILLLPGSNSVKDYFKYNLRPLRLGDEVLRLKDGKVERGASGTKWHQGFLRYSKFVFDWLKEEGVKPNYIIGHSLGAAAAQILSKTYNVPAIAFAAPRPKRSKNGVIHDGRCLIINRTDDPVAKAPDLYFHMGSPKLLKSVTDKAFWAHAMPRYVKIVDEGIASDDLPESWSG
jgi:pimeloyl-ACP methyl ester carboxylesterase